MANRPAKREPAMRDEPLTARDLIDLPVSGKKCICPYTDPSTWLSAASCGYGSGYEPGSMQEWEPDCPAHPPYREPR